jgi:hypothetical protein
MIRIIGHDNRQKMKRKNTERTNTQLFSISKNILNEEGAIELGISKPTTQPHSHSVSQSVSKLIENFVCLN